MTKTNLSKELRNRNFYVLEMEDLIDGEVIGLLDNFSNSINDIKHISKQTKNGLTYWSIIVDGQCFKTDGQKYANLLIVTKENKSYLLSCYTEYTLKECYISMLELIDIWLNKDVDFDAEFKSKNESNVYNYQTFING